MFKRYWTALSIPDNNMICKLKPKTSEVMSSCTCHFLVLKAPTTAQQLKNGFMCMTKIII